MHNPYFFRSVNPTLPDSLFSFGNVHKVLLVQVSIRIMAFPFDKLRHNTVPFSMGDYQTYV